MTNRTLAGSAGVGVGVSAPDFVACSGRYCGERSGCVLCDAAASGPVVSSCVLSGSAVFLTEGVATILGVALVGSSVLGIRGILITEVCDLNFSK